MNWKFDENVTPVFDDHVRNHAFNYEKMTDIVVKISEWFIEDGDNVYDIGCSTGNMMNLISKMHKEKNLRMIGMDNSVSMLEESKKRYSEFNFSLIDLNKAKIELDNTNFVSSFLTMMFLSKPNRLKVISDIYEQINEGGIFIMAEKVHCDHGIFQEINSSQYDEFKRKNGVSDKDVLDKTKSIRGVLKSMTLQENIELLNRAGFKKTEILFKENNFCLIAGVK